MSERKTLSHHTFRRTARLRAEHLDRKAKIVLDWLEEDTTPHTELAAGQVGTGTPDLPRKVRAAAEELIHAGSWYTYNHTVGRRRGGLRWTVEAIIP